MPTSGLKSKWTAQTNKSLPPSLRLHKDVRSPSVYMNDGLVGDNTSGEAEISYQICATLLFEGRRIADTSRRIVLIPITEPCPPLEIGDFAGEYQTTASTSVMSISKLKRWGHLSVSTVEPEPLILAMEKATSVSASKVFLKFQFRQPAGAPCNALYDGPGILDCDVVTNLEATNYFSIRGHSYVFSSKEAARSPFIAQDTYMTLPQMHKIQLRLWRRISGEVCRLILFQMSPCLPLVLGVHDKNNERCVMMERVVTDCG